MVIGTQLNVDVEAISSFCKENRIRRLAVFGSALRDDFGPESDVDLLVDFEPGSTPGLLRIAAIERALSGMFAAREVELRTLGDLSRYFRDEVQAEAVPIYDAAA